MSLFCITFESNADGHYSGMFYYFFFESACLRRAGRYLHEIPYTMIEGYGEFASLRQFIEVFFFFCVKMTLKLFFGAVLDGFFGWKNG